MKKLLCFLITVLFLTTVATASIEHDFDIGITYYSINLGDKIQTTHTHVDDYSYLGHGDTTASINNALDFSFGGSVDFVSDNDGVKWLFGIGGRLNAGILTSGYRGGNYQVEQQRGDERRKDQQSYVFTQFIPYPVIEPHVGVKFKLFDHDTTIRYGLPWTWFRVKSGHDRYGRWETVQNEMWSGFGQSASIGMNMDKYLEGFYWGVKYERYRLEFANEIGLIEGYTIFMRFTNNF